MALGAGVQTRNAAHIRFVQTRPGPTVRHSMAASSRSIAASPLARGQSLVFQLEIDCKELPKPPPIPQLAQRNVHAVLDRVEQLLRPETNFEARLARDARYYHGTIVEEEGRADVVVLGSSLAGVGHAVTIRTAVGGGSGVSAFKHLSHEFLVVAGPGPDGFHYRDCAEFIVDPRFREQFDIPQAVPWYNEVLHSIPEVYVGIASRLRPLVRVLGTEMAAAFAAAGAVTPPWRTPSSLLSKWLPKVSRDRASSTDSLMPATASYPSPTLRRAAVSRSGHRSKMRSDSIQFTSRRDFQLPDVPGAMDVQQRTPQHSGEMLVSRRFGSSRFDASVPIKLDRRRSRSLAGSESLEGSVRSASYLPAAGSGQQHRSLSADAGAASPNSSRQDDRNGVLRAHQTVATAAVAASLISSRQHIADSSKQPSMRRAAGSDSSLSDGCSEGTASNVAAASGIEPPAALHPFVRDSMEYTAQNSGASPVAASSLIQSLEVSISNSGGLKRATPIQQPIPAAAHPQSLSPQRHRSAPADAAENANKLSVSEQPQRTVSTSALSRKLASMQPTAIPHYAVSPFTTTTWPNTKQTLEQAEGLKSLQHPSVHAPFWEEPLVMAYIAKQHPSNTRHMHWQSQTHKDLPKTDVDNEGRTPFNVLSRTAGGGNARSAVGNDRNASSTESGLSVSTGGASKAAPPEPRIRKVKMRGTGGAMPSKTAVQGPR